MPNPSELERQAEPNRTERAAEAIMYSCHFWSENFRQCIMRHLLAAETRGAKRMRERAAQVCDAAEQTNLHGSAEVDTSPEALARRIRSLET